MSMFYYDLHVHSCLSPCGDDDMTPGNIAGMAVVNGLQIVALTDHNSVKNCPAFYAQARKNGIIPIAGMELTTSEDVHMICLFPTLEKAMAFGEVVEGRRIRVKNKPAIFGHQHIRDENDEIIGEEEFLLINATDISIEEAAELCRAEDGVCYPAHIDRPSNGIVAVLGTFPEDVQFTAYELNDGTSLAEYTERFPKLGELAHVVSSDAHYLWDLSEAEHALELPDDDIRMGLMRYLQGKVNAEGEYHG